ncbi:MAG: type II toxin-antitoxin system RelE/ParE family toxin [Verrucomicrobiales bacterium]|nr:type II toxin-antitoxin system RelE/ParE family toxin [Verrucomicrobiales bacterium]
MGCKIIFAPQAIADLEIVVRHIAKDDPITAERIGNSLIDRVAILENFPLLGSPYAKRPGVRKLVSRPYIIFYRPKLEEARVDILRYWHGARGDVELRE